MSARRLLAAVAGAGMVALLAWRGCRAPQLRYYHPEKYVARADAFIRNGYLRADCVGPRPTLVAELQGAPAAEQRWFDASYLADDVRRFNDDPDFGWTFVVDDDCRLRGVNPSVHRIELPFGRPIRWLGTLFYSGPGSSATLRSALRTITLVQPALPAPARAAAITAVGASEDVADRSAVLLHFAAGPERPAARFWSVGAPTILGNLVRRGAPETVHLLGQRLPVSAQARLETGDWVHVEAAAPAGVAETFVYVEAAALSAASRIRLANDRRQRTSDDPGLGLVSAPGQQSPSPYLAVVAASVDNALATLPDSRARALADDFDAQLSLERGVQLQLSRSFADAVRRVQALHPGRPFGAGMTVLDGKTGDVLALATYPEDLAGLALSDEAEGRRLLRNQNLVLHPIGSAGKPFYFAAIADAHPFLTELVIDPYAATLERRELLHCDLGKGYRVPAGHDMPVDFRTALQISSNRYAVELATLALAADGGRPGALEQRLPAERGLAWPRPGHRSGIQIGGRTLDYAPEIGYLVTPRPLQRPAGGAVLGCRALDRLEEARFRLPLELLTGAETYWGRYPQRLPSAPTRSQLDDAFRTGRFDLSLFRPLLERLFAGATEEEQWKIRASAQEMSPERVNLAFNQVTGVRTDYVNLLLGGANSIWTNVQLAESMARLVTGRAVEARLLTRVFPRRDGEPPPPAAPRALASELPISPAARQLVLEGLERVGRPGGTAPRMAETLAAIRARFPGDRIDLYSKTGSPNTERAVTRRVPRALTSLVGRSRLVLRGRTPVVRTAADEVPYAAPGTSGRAAFRAALVAALREVREPPTPALVSYLADLLDDFAVELTATGTPPGDGPIGVEGGAIRLNRNHGLFRRNLLPGKGAVYILTLVRQPAATAAPPTPAAFDDPRVHVLSVAIHVDVGPDASVAVEVGASLLPEVARLLE